MLPFNELPASLRLPGVHIEIDNSLAAQAEQQFKLLVIGQRLSSGAVAEAVPTRITSYNQAEEAFGRGSMLAEMFRKIKKIDQFTETWAIALDDNGAAAAAGGSVAVSGTATATGTITLYIAGQKVQAAVASGDTGATVAAALAAAISADTTLPVEAVVNGTVDTQVDLTCRWKGETGNDIDIRTNYYGEKIPAGLTVAITAMAGGTANPDIATAIAAMGDEWYNWIVMPYTDTANLAALEAELDGRYGPMEQKGGRAFCAYRGNHGATGSFGSGRNSPHVSCMGTNLCPTPPYLFAAINAIAAAGPLALDPARPLQTIWLEGALPPAINDRWDDAERNLLLYDGIATYKVTSDGRCVIERQITMYQTNDVGVNDISYLDINRPETLERIRYEQRAAIALKFPRHKLSDDNEARFAPGQPIVTDTVVKGELLARYQQFIEDGWCDDFEAYKASIIVEIDTANGRINWKDEPNLVGQARTFAGLIQFRI